MMIQKLRTFCEQLGQRAAVKSAIINTGWMALDRVIRLIGGLLIGVWVARYLGPGQFGIFSTLLSINGVALTVCGLAFDAVITRYFVRYPHHSAVFLGTTVTIRAALGVVVGVAMLVLGYIKPMPGVHLYIWAAMSVTLFFTAFNALRQYYDARGESKRVILPELVAFGVSSVLRIVGIVWHFPLEWFVGIVLMEGVLGLIGYHWVYWRKGMVSRWTFRFSIARLLFRHSWPILLTSGATLIYFKIDQMMLFSMVGSREAGIYSAAVRVSEIAYFFPVILTTALYPAITKLRKVDPVRYRQELTRAFSICMAFSYGVIGCAVLGSAWGVSLLYGADYQAAAPILVVHIGSLIWVSHWMIASIYITNEGLTRHYLLKDSIAALCNVVLNLVLIPHWSGLGSAIATLVSYSITAFFANALIPAFRPLYHPQLDGFALKGLFRDFDCRVD